MKCQRKYWIVRRTLVHCEIMEILRDKKNEEIEQASARHTYDIDTHITLT